MDILLTIAPLWPELLIGIGALALLMLGVFCKEISPHFIVLSACLLCVIAIIMEALIWNDAPVAFMNALIFTQFTVFGKILVLVGTLISLILSLQWLHSETNGRSEYPVLMLLATLGLMLMISSDSMLALYVGLELASLSLYVLAAFSRDSLHSTEAGLKYFVLGSLASCLLLFGMSLVYGFTGALGFDAIADAIATMLNGDTHMLVRAEAYGVILGLVLILCAFMFKLSAAPFHMWTPDVYQGAPTPVTAFFSMAPKVAAMVLLVQLLGRAFADLFIYWQQIIVVAAIASMLIGALGAIMQKNIKRMLAYSSIGHVGFMLVGLAAGAEASAASILIYLSLYVFMSAGAFAIVLCMRRSGQYVELLEDMAGISKTNPLLAFCMAVMMFSMAGIPPMAGFFGKLYVFSAAVQAGLYVLVVIGLVCSVVAAYYYLRIVKIMYFDDAEDGFDAPHPLLKTVAVLMTVGVVGFIVYPSSIITPATVAVKQMESRLPQTDLGLSGANTKNSNKPQQPEVSSASTTDAAPE